MARLQKTSNYSRFKFMKGQRPINMLSPECRALKKSMEQYGYLPAFPVMVRPNGSAGNFVIVDGQHRFSVAKELGLDVYYVIDSTDIDVSEVNKGQRKWTAFDYAHRWAASGKRDYQELLDYHHAYGIPLTVAAGVLAGTIRFANIKDKFYDGRFKITNEDMAIRFGEAASRMAKVNKFAKNHQFLIALWSCYFVEYFDPDRLASAVEKRPSLLSSCGDRESFLQSIEEIYNFGKKSRAPLKFDAEEAMRERNPGVAWRRKA